MTNKFRYVMLFVTGMSVAEETLKAREVPKRKSAPIVNRFLDFISSVRFGVSQLIALVVLSMIGMIIVQQNVEPAFATYFASLTPAEKLVFGKLGFFNIYKTWYFNGLLLVLSLNIVLASIDRFPSAWNYIVKPKLWATKKWLLAQPQNESVLLSDSLPTAAEKVRTVFEQNGLHTTIFEKAGQLFVFGERGKYNRIGAYIVHVCLLTLFLGHFVANQTGIDATVRLTPGEVTDQIRQLEFDLDRKLEFNVQLPFTLTCTDIQQKLIDPRGSIDVTNTLDWRTQMKVNDPEYGETVADISMNKPFSYRGYRFFQAQTIPVGNARQITLDITPQNGGEKQQLTIPRLGSTTLTDGTAVEYDEFLPDFVFGSDGKPDTRSGEYNNPVAVLNVTPPNGERTRVFAFAGNVAENIPVGAPKAGYKWRLAEYEKSPFAHVLSIKYDPYNAAFIAWYFGGFGLIGALGFVFFFSHKRIWALIERRDDGAVDVTLGGNTNRNHVGFEEKFSKIKAELQRS